MTILEEQTAAAHQYAELWRAVMSGVETPADDQFLIWAGSYKKSQVVRGINGAARKFRAMQNASRSMTANDVARYAASIMRNERAGRHIFQTATTAH